MKLPSYSCRQTHGGAVLPPPRLTPKRERAGEGSSAPAQRASTAARPFGPSVAARRLDADPVSPRGQGRRGGGRSSPPGTKPSQASGRPSLRACGVEGRRAPRGRAFRGRGAFVHSHQLQPHRAPLGVPQRDPSPRRVGLVDHASLLERLEHAPRRGVSDDVHDRRCVGRAPLAGFVDYDLENLALVRCGVARSRHLVPCCCYQLRGLRLSPIGGYTNTVGAARGRSARTAPPMSVLGGSAIGGAAHSRKRRHDHEPR